MSSCRAANAKSWDDEETWELDVHGGITYGESCADDVCHVPKPGEPDDVWWLGFDCAHAGDASPRDAYEGFPYGSYKALVYVQEQARQLAEQLAAMVAA